MKAQFTFSNMFYMAFPVRLFADLILKFLRVELWLPLLDFIFFSLSKAELATRFISVEQILTFCSSVSWWPPFCVGFENVRGSTAKPPPPKNHCWCLDTVFLTKKKKIQFLKWFSGCKSNFRVNFFPVGSSNTIG